MANTGSTLPPSLGKVNSPLKTKVEELGVLDQIAHLGKQFTEGEKKQYFNSLPGKKYKIGLIRNKELDTVVKIFTESFDFSKKISISLSKADMFVSKVCSGEDKAAEDGVSVATGDRATAAAVGDANVDPYANVPESASNPYNADNLDDIPLNGFNRSGNSEVERLNVPPETIGTSSDFERVYLGWMNNPDLDITSPNGLKDEEKRKKRNSVKSLFRFVFGTKNISDVTATTLQKKLRLAYTPLTSEEKLPCEDSGFWPDFRESLVYRRRLAMCELFAARDVLGDEKRLYINRKKELALGLRDLIDVLDRNVYPCMVYAYDANQHEEEKVALMNDEEFSRILKVFRTFVKDKKEGREYYSLNTLKKELSKKEKSFETSTLLYAELLSLLTWMAGEAEATAKITQLQSDLSTVRGIAEKQKEDITGLEDLVILLSVLLAISEKIHKITLALSELKCISVKCCNKKKAEKLARSVSVQNTDIQTLENEIQKTNQEYQVVVTKLKKTIGKQSDDIQELEEVLLALTQIVISIDKVHTINMNLSDMRQKLRECCEKKKVVDSYTSQIESLNKVLLKRDIGGQDAQTVAATSMVNQGLQFANTANSELEKQITELRQGIKGRVDDGVKKEKINDNLETESANKDVIVRELEEITEALLKISIGIKGIRDIERNLGALSNSIELCCERRKAVRECQEKLDLLEARIHELSEKGGKTNELETALQEQRHKADEAGAALKGQLNTLKSELEDVMSNSKDELESVRSDLREEANNDSEHAAELASRIQELDSQIIAAEAAVKEAEGRGSSNARQPMVVQNSRQYEKELVNASLVDENTKSRSEAVQRAQQTEIEELTRKSAELVTELEAARAEARQAGQAGEINRLSKRIKQLDQESLYKNRVISHLEEEAHEQQTLAKPKSVFNRLYPKNPVGMRPAWKPSEYRARAAMGVGGVEQKGDGLKGDRLKGGGLKGDRQKGDRQKKPFCEVMLTLLLLELSENEEFNTEVFLKKAGTTLDDLGQCPLVLRALAEIIDETLNQEVPEDGYMYSPANGVTNTAFAEQLESAYAKNFTQAEKNALLHSAPPIIYYSKSPEEFEGILGNRPYFLNGANAQAGEVRLRGVNMDDDEDPVMMTGEERELVEKGGVPLGTIIFLYLTCLKDHEEEDGEEGLLALRSNASNDAAN